MKLLAILIGLATATAHAAPYIPVGTAKTKKTIIAFPEIR